MEPSHIRTLNALIKLSKNSCLSICVQHHLGNPINGVFDFYINTFDKLNPNIEICVKNRQHLAQVLELMGKELNKGDGIEDQVWGFNP